MTYSSLNDERQDKICPMHGETASFTAPSANYVKEPGCTCVVWPFKAPEKPVGADLQDVCIDVADGAMSVYHESCGAVLLFTMVVHLSTLTRVAAEHVCLQPVTNRCPWCNGADRAVRPRRNDIGMTCQNDWHTEA